MKRSLLGLVAATSVLIGLAVAAPGTAVAAQPGETCATLSDQLDITASNPASDHYYTDCEPHFGQIPVRFYLDSAHSFTAVNLTDKKQIQGIYSTLPATALSRAGGPSGGLSIRSGSGHGLYTADATLQITRLSRIPVSALGSGCRASSVHYDAAYRISYAPIDTTIQMAKGTQQTWSGNPAAFELAHATTSLYLGLNFAEGTTSSNPTQHFEPTRAQCATYGSETIFAANASVAQSAWQTVVSSAIYSSPLYFPLGLGYVPIGRPLFTPAVILQTTSGTDAALIVTVRWRDEYMHGTVSVSVAGKRVKTDGALVGGKLRLTLPHGLKGTHSVTVDYPGGPDALPTMVSKNIVITR